MPLVLRSCILQGIVLFLYLFSGGYDKSIKVQTYYLIFILGNVSLSPVPSNNLNTSQQALAPSVITQPNQTMNEKEVLQTMETLMNSMSSGDWGRIMPDQFYSLLDSLQGMDGLDPNDIDQLEESYTKYLKLQGTFDDLEDDVELKPELLQPSILHGGLAINNGSPCNSPYVSPIPNHSPLMMNSARLSPSRSSNNSRGSSLLNSQNLDSVLKPGVYDNLNMSSTGTTMNSYNQNMNTLVTSPNVNVLGTSPIMNVLGPNTNYNAATPNTCYNVNRPSMIYTTGAGPVVVEDELEEEFDWSSIM